MDKRKRLKQVFQKIFNTNLDYNKLSTKELENWDSVNHLMLIMSLEEEYNIGTKTITDLIDTESELLTIYESYFNSKKDFILNYFEIKALEGTLVDLFQNYLPEFN